GRASARPREGGDAPPRRWIWDETRADERIAERLDEIVAGRVSPYEVAAEVLEGLKQGERIRRPGAPNTTKRSPAGWPTRSASWRGSGRRSRSGGPPRPGSPRAPT